MPLPPPSSPPSRLASLGLLTGIAWLATMAWTTAIGPITHGFAAYLAAARVFRGGLLGPWVYDDARFIDFVQRSLGTGVIDIFGPNTPAMALLAWPVAGWPMPAARGVWLAASVAAWGWTLRRHTRATPPDADWRTTGLMLALCVMPAVTANLRTAQAYLLVAALLAAAARQLGARHDARGGALIGAALVTKTAGLGLLPVLLVLRRWRALAAVATAYAAGIAITLGGDGLGAWARYPGYVRDFASDPRTLVAAYQSTSGLVRHLCVADARWNPVPAADCAPVAWVVPLTLLLFVTIGTAVMARRAHDEPPAWLAAALTLSVLLVPAAEEHQFVQLAAPALLVVSTQTRACAWWPWLVFAALLYTPLALAPGDAPAGWAAVLAYPRLAAAWWLWGLAIVELRAGARASTGPASA